MNGRHLHVRKANHADTPSIEALQARVYVEEGYLPEETARVTCTDIPFTDPLLTDTFIAVRKTADEEEEIVGTLSLTEVDERGLPSFHRDFPSLVLLLKEEPGTFCVLWRYIVIPNCRKNFHAALLLIMEALLAGRRRNATRALCAVNPEKHEPFYRDHLGFTEIARCPNISGLQNAPAVLLIANVDDLNERCLPMVKRMGQIRKTMCTTLGDTQEVVLTSTGGHALW